MSLDRHQWTALMWVVFNRDLYQAWMRAGSPLRFEAWANRNPEKACVAAFLDLNQSGTCSGRLTFDHVKDQPKIGDPIRKRHTEDRKAPDDEQHLQTVCEHHHGLDMVGGAGWAGSKLGRALSRDYLDALYV